MCCENMYLVSWRTLTVKDSIYKPINQVPNQAWLVCQMRDSVDEN